MPANRITKFAAAAGIAVTALLGTGAGTANAATAPDQVVMIVDQQGNVLEDSGGQPGMGFRNNSANEKWIKHQVGAPGLFRYKNVETGRCLHAPAPKTQGSKVDLATCDLGATYRWKLVGPAEQFHEMITYNGGLALTNFAKLSLFANNGGGAQQFKEIPA